MLITQLFPRSEASNRPPLARAAIRQKCSEADIQKPPIVVEDDEADVCPARGGFIGIVPCRYLRPSPGKPQCRIIGRSRSSAR